MSYDDHDAAMDTFYERVAEELYPEHKAQAIEEFTAERLKSFYVTNPQVMVPAVLAYREAKNLKANGHDSACVVFSVTAMEVFFKATVLKPVIYGLVHHDSLAAIVVEHTLGQTGFDRYKTLLSRLYLDLASIDLITMKRPESERPLLEEAMTIQKLRNRIIHQGQSCSAEDATHALSVTSAVYSKVVLPLLTKLGLGVHERGVLLAL